MYICKWAYLHMYICTSYIFSMHRLDEKQLKIFADKQNGIVCMYICTYTKRWLKKVQSKSFLENPARFFKASFKIS